MIRWVFLDIGNVLFNDDPQTYYIHRRYHAAAARRTISFTFADFLRDRECEVRTGNRWPTQTVLRRHLSETELAELFHIVEQELRPIYDEMNFPMPHCVPLLDALSARYRLGIIANQLRECRGSLERRGLMPYFDEVAISEECGWHKPDPALFQHALSRAGVRPNEAVMVGDRHDNDVVPAAELGMHTVWVRWRSLAGKGWEPSDPDARAFVESHEREPFYGRMTQPHITASAEVADLYGVPSAIEQLHTASM